MRFDIDTFTEIADSLTRNKSRSILTGFGVFWGIFMLLVLMGGGQGLKSVLSKNFEGFASNTTVFFSTNTSKPYKGFKKGRYWRMTYKDIDRLKLMIPELDVVTPMVSNWDQTAVYGTNTISSNIKGIYADYAKIEAPKLKYGRYLNDTDILQKRKVCVIGKRIYTTLFPEGGDPCGKYIKVGSIYYRIIGVDYNAANIGINGRADETISIPLPIAQQIYNRGNFIDVICVTGQAGVQKMSSLEPRIRQVMGLEHSFDPDDKQAMMLLNADELFAVVDNLFRGLNFLIWLIGLGTILAGAIGVSNIMMVTVKERTIEIGIRRAIGATPKDILSQIIAESISLTMVAGSAGIVISVLFLSVIEKVTKSPAFQINFWTAVFAALFLTALGVLAGLAPAMRAMKIKPVDAMRDE